MTGDETLETIGGRNVLRLQRRLAHPPEKVWRALTEPGQLTHWFPSDVQVVGADLAAPLVAGAAIRFVFRAGEGPAQDGRVVELDPPHVLAYTWGDSLLRWELRPDPGAGCVLVFTHAFDDRPAAASFAAGWDACLGALAQVLAGEAVHLPDDYPQRHEAYVAQLGLGEGRLATGDDGGRVVRFDRQLPWPLGRVWAFLTDGATADALRAGQPVPAGATAAGGAAAGGGDADAGAAAPRSGHQVVAVEPPHLLAVDGDRDVAGGGEVRWALSEGPGGGRVVLTQRVPADRTDVQVAALVAWHLRLRRLAESLAGATPAPGDAAALQDRYGKVVADDT